MTTPLKLKIELNRRFIEIIYGRENLSELNYINVSKRNINYIDSTTFKDLVNLESLHLDHNEIENIDSKLFDFLSKLNSLSLSFNSLKKLGSNTFIQLGNLEDLYLIKVELEEINASLFTGLRSLKNLYLAGNKLEKLDAKTFSGLEKLCVLGLDWNRISVIDSKAFENLSALKNLSLNNNRLERIDPKTFGGLNNLEFLDLSENKIEAIDSKLFDGLSNLISLYLSNNLLERIDENTFKGLKQLDKLFLDKNYLEVIDIKLFKYLPKLSMLRLNNNALKETDRKCFEPLEKSIDKLILYENNTNMRSFIRFSFVATLKDWPDKDKLYQNGFLTNFSDFLNQFSEKEKASSSTTTSTIKTASVASIITPISSNSDEIFVDPYVGKKFKNRYEVVEKLGQGQYGLVYLVNDTDIRVKKAMKIMDELDSSTPIELDILWENNHENIVRYFDHFHLKIGVDDKTFLITEFCEKGDLKKQIDLKKRRGENFSEEDILKWIYQAAKALEYLHSRDPPIIHRDIKPANMLLTGKNEIRLADLGLAKLMFESHASSYAGSPAYMSPEVFKSLSENEIYYPNADVWSLGCVLYELVFLKYAFPSGQRENPEIPDNLSESDLFSGILSMMLNKDKKTRITSSKLIDEISKLLRR